MNTLVAGILMNPLIADIMILNQARIISSTWTVGGLAP